MYSGIWRGRKKKTFIADTTVEPQMVVRESLQETKNFFHKSLKNLKSFPFLSCIGKKQKSHQTDQFCIDFSNEWGTHQSKAKKNLLSLKDSMKEEDGCSGGYVKFANQEEGGKGKKNMESLQLVKREDPISSSQKKNGGGGGGYALAQKMKELEMMDVGDVEHVLDVEEALHYYSRLKSPVYLDIVDDFFMDMYSEFSASQASASINNSKRRLGNSKRRLGSIRL